MFQYAFARMLSLRAKLPLFHDLEWYRSGPGLGRPDRPFLMDRFRIVAREAGPVERKSVYPPRRLASLLVHRPWMSKFWPGPCPILETADSVVRQADSYRKEWAEHDRSAYVSGFFASHLYADSIRSHLLSELSLVDPDHQLALKCSELRGENTVAVCYRSGDYKLISSLGIMPDDYYRKAIDLLRARVPNARFIAFTDELERALPVLSPLGVEFPEWANAKRCATQKMELIKSCRHYVVTNSTFGWWAAWLGQSAESVVVRPSLWFVGLGRPYSNLFPPQWLTVFAE